jgi:hypothetical protein
VRVLLIGQYGGSSHGNRHVALILLPMPGTIPRDPLDEQYQRDDD